MSQEEKARKAAEDLGSSIHEMIDNARAIKGDHFADVVGTVFNLHQLIEILARLSANSELDKEYAETIARTGVSLVSSVSAFAVDTIESDELAQEAFNLAMRLDEMRGALNTELNK